MAKKSENNELNKIWKLLDEDRKEKKYEDLKNKSVAHFVFGAIVFAVIASVFLVIAKYLGIYLAFALGKNLFNGFEFTALISFVGTLIACWTAAPFARKSLELKKEANKYKVKE